MKVLVLTLLCILIEANEAKIFERCELAKDLKQEGMDGYEDISLDNWMCMAKSESNYNSGAVGQPNEDGSRDYGIFQINSHYWCTNGEGHSVNACHTPCSAFTNDDIKDDIECAKRVVRDPQGMDAWFGWKKDCKGKDLSEYTRGCQL